MDIQMPKMDGIHASELIRQLPHHNSTPIVAVTAHAASGEREHLLQAGMDDYLAKPIDEKMLTRVLSRYHSGDVENAVADDAPLSLDCRWRCVRRPINRIWRAICCKCCSISRRRCASGCKRCSTASMTTRSSIWSISCTAAAATAACRASKQLCFYLERQLRQGVTNDELEPEWLELLDEIELVIHAARAHLTQPA